MRLGYLDGGRARVQRFKTYATSLYWGMRDLGYNEGRDYMLEERYAEGRTNV